MQTKNYLPIPRFAGPAKCYLETTLFFILDNFFSKEVVWIGLHNNNGSNKWYWLNETKVCKVILQKREAISDSRIA